MNWRTISIIFYSYGTRYLHSCCLLTGTQLYKKCECHVFLLWDRVEVEAISEHLPVSSRAWSGLTRGVLSWTTSPIPWWFTICSCRNAGRDGQLCYRNLRTKLYMNQTTYFVHLWYGSSQAHTLLARNILGDFSVIDTQHLVHSATCLTVKAMKNMAAICTKKLLPKNCNKHIIRGKKYAQWGDSLHLRCHRNNQHDMHRPGKSEIL